VAPHRFAAGVPLKVIEAMAHGLPCVVSELLADQLGVTAGVHALVASETDEFVVEMMRLYTDEELWLTIQRRGLRFIQERYDPERMRGQLQELVERPAANFSSATAPATID
jgi:glycosyltransferase involved in cell wall biosynthesis